MDFEAHALGYLGADEAADAVGLPASQVHDSLQGCTGGALEKRDDILGLGERCWHRLHLMLQLLKLGPDSLYSGRAVGESG